MKPRDNEAILEKMQEAAAAGAIAVGMDLDAAALINMTRAGRVGPQDEGTIGGAETSCALPFFVKGIMTEADAIAVKTVPQFVADQSDPDSERYVFAYTMSSNIGTVAAQLISRHWIITDGDSRIQEVRGLGVVGEQPLLRPGEKFEYTERLPA